MPQTNPFRAGMGISLLLFMSPLLVFGQAQPQSTPAAQVVQSAHITWDGKPKITRYRLQLSRDEEFTDIVFDKVVEGREYKVTEIPIGKYFWRVAPAARETGVYSRPVAVVVSTEGTVETPKVESPALLTPPSDVGWRTATGMIEHPVAAKLRSGTALDVIGVNSYGMVYAIDGQKGIALWSARYRPSAKKGEPVNSDGGPSFAPLLLEAKDKTTSVLVAFDGGVRALEGVTGRELWRAALSGEAIVGVSLANENDAGGVAAVFDSTQTLTYLKSDSGQIISQTKLDGTMVGGPVAIVVKNERGVLLALNNGTIDVRNLAGVSILAIKLDAAITAGPLIVKSSKGQLAMLGTEAGLVAIDAATLSPLWRVETTSDAPVGMLAAIDVESDGTDEVVMITRRGRLVTINVETGKIRWYAETLTDATRATFADVNGDGANDVLIAGGSAFALGYSGKDGKLIWKADEPASNQSAGDKKTTRILVAALFGADGSGLLVGTEPGRTGLRAVGLPAGALK